MARAPADLIAGEVGSDRVEPGRKFPAEVKFRPLLVNPDKTLLGGFRGVLFILQDTDQVMKQAFAVALHQIVQRGVVAAGQALHVNGILVVTGGRLHAWTPDLTLFRASGVPAKRSWPEPTRGSVSPGREACFG